MKNAPHSRRIFCNEIPQSSMGFPSTHKKPQAPHAEVFVICRLKSFFVNNFS